MTFTVSKYTQSKIAILIVMILFFGLVLNYLNFLNKDFMIPIESVEDFEYIRNGIIYFGRPTCPNCAKFEPILKNIAMKHKINVHYFNTDYFRNNSLLTEDELQIIFKEYKVEHVPLLVGVTHGIASGFYDADSLYEDTHQFRIRDISDFLIEYKIYSDQYIPHYTIDSILVMLSIAIFLMSFTLKSAFLREKGLIFFTINFLNGFILLLTLGNFGFSIAYLEKTGFSGSGFYGSLSCITVVLSIVTFIKLCFIKRESGRV